MPLTIPTYNPPDQNSPALIQYLQNKPGYYQEYNRHMGWVKENQPGNDNRNFATWFKDHLTGNKEDELWQDDAIKGFLETGMFKAPATGGAGTGQEPTVDPTPPTPDSPVRDSSGTLLTAPTAPSTPPPVSDRSSEVFQAGRAARQANRRRKGFLSTLLAGETGGAQSPIKTLLGQ